MNVSRPIWLPVVAAIFGFAAVLPAAAQTPTVPGPAGPPEPPAASAPADKFGEDVTLTEKTIVYLAGSGLWDSAFETIIDAFKSVNEALEKQGIKANGPPMVIYTATDDTGFQFLAAAPVAQAPQLPPGDIKAGKSPIGKALKFVHRGSYESMDTTYEAITNYLDDKRLDARDLFIEQFIKDPLTTAEDDLVIEVYVPLK
jgi:effector-binding domain-containing protein